MNNTSSILSRLENIDNLDDFWGNTNIALERFGVTSIMYGAIATRHELDFGARTESMIWKTNHGSEFFKRFCTLGSDDSIDNCLTFEHCLYNTTPFFWHDLSMWEGASPLQMAHALAAKELGLYVGFTLPTRSFGEERFGAISVSTGGHSPETFDQMWEAKSSDLMSILELLDRRMRERFLADVICLAPREKEAMEWLASGLRPVQVAERMSIGFRTVDKYINNAKKKLKAKSRDQAIAKAIIFNVI